MYAFKLVRLYCKCNLNNGKPLAKNGNYLTITMGVDILAELQETFHLAVRHLTNTCTHCELFNKWFERECNIDSDQRSIHCLRLL